MRWPVGVVLLACLLSAAAPRAQQTPASLPQLNNYAWGFHIDAAGDKSFYRAELPLIVNRSADDSRLRDSGVYNSAGQPVPRLIEEATDTLEERETRTALTAMPLYRNQEADPEQLRVIFERNGDRTQVDIDANGAASQKMRPPLTAYIADARDHDEAVYALELSWPASRGGFVGHVAVDGSDDLETWHELGGGAVAELRENDAVIVQRDVEIRRSRYDFLRLRWRDLPAEWRLTGIDAVHRDRQRHAARKWLTLDSSTRDDEDGGLIFTLDVRPRIDQVQLALPDDNTVLGVDIYYWVEASLRWMHVGGNAFYRIRRGENAVRNEPLPIAAVRADRWKVRVRKGRPDMPLQLRLGWRPDTLLFVAEGNAPYTLATGRPHAGAEYFPEDRALGDRSIKRLAADNGPVGRATIGERFPLGGVTHAGVPEGPDWRTILLWSGLLAAVLFVAYMALRLFREL